jgi:hypothetical protein
MKTVFTLIGLSAVAISLRLLPGQAAITAGSPHNSLQEQVVAQERQELDSIESGSLDAFSSLIADDAVFVDAHGTAGKAEVVKQVAEFRLVEYSMEGVKFVPLSTKSGVIAYRLVEKGISHGKEFASEVYASAVWAERGGKWVCVFSQETPAR